tara:strand:- start:304 stop:891 length:588 start_codon:yes stop_codon:yes gene_type:complete
MRASRKNGFTLIEVLIVSTIAALTASWVLPTVRRQLLQKEVDQYSRQVEVGLFNLRTRLREERLSHCICFEANSWAPPSSMGLERQQPDGSQAETFPECSEEDPSKRLRVMNLEGSHSSRKVQALSLESKFCLSPPGTSATPKSFTLLLKSLQSSSDSRLLVRCLHMSGNGYLIRGDWDDISKICRPKWGKRLLE